MRRAVLVMIVSLASASCSSQGGDGSAAAKKAVSASLGDPPGLVFEDLKPKHLTGLKGSTAEVICGDVARNANAVPSHFIYIWKLQPAVPNTGRTTGETMVFPVMDRRAVHELTYFCEDKPDRSTANDYDYFS